MNEVSSKQDVDLRDGFCDVMAMKWPRVMIQTAEGANEGVAPQIISASRATDIPAFHSAWLIERLRAGYCRWVNPFNGQGQYVGFQNARAFVFWTKDVRPLIEHLGEFDRRGICYCFQFTVNDYEDEGLERNVPPLAERVKAFVELSRLIGREKVIWRFDPLLLADAISLDALAQKLRRVGQQLHEHTEKLVVSFADIAAYAKVRRKLRRWPGGAREWGEREMKQMAGRIAEMANEWGIEAATCCERVDLGEFGLAHNRCIDGELLLRISGNDAELARVLGRGRGKDPGQRDACGCAMSKDIGAYDTCSHGCLYCYANKVPCEGG